MRLEALDFIEETVDSNPSMNQNSIDHQGGDEFTEIGEFLKLHVYRCDVNGEEHQACILNVENDRVVAVLSHDTQVYDFDLDGNAYRNEHKATLIWEEQTPTQFWEIPTSFNGDAVGSFLAIALPFTVLKCKNDELYVVTEVNNDELYAIQGVRACSNDIGFAKWTSNGELVYSLRLPGDVSSVLIRDRTSNIKH